MGSSYYPAAVLDHGTAVFLWVHRITIHNLSCVTYLPLRCFFPCFSAATPAENLGCIPVHTSVHT